MNLQSKQQIIEQLTASAKNLRTVRERASTQRDIESLGEPAAATPGASSVQTTTLQGSQANRRDSTGV
jgi:hypothetical protein